MKHLQITMIALLIFLLAACKEEPKVISVDALSFNLTYDTQNGIFSVESNTEWDAVSTQSWLDVTKTSGITGSYSAEMNTTSEYRTADVEISGTDAQTKTIMFRQEPFPVYKNWMRTGDGFREYMLFNAEMTGEYSWFDTATQTYTEERSFTFVFDSEKITFTFLDNYEEMIFFYAFSSDRSLMTLTNSYGDHYNYN